MRGTAFFDMESREHGSLHIVSNGGGILETRHFDVDSGFAFHAGELPDRIEDCWLSLPLEMLNFRVLELPFTDMERIREVLPFELEGLILGSTKDYVIDALPLSSPGSSQRVLAVYMEKDTLRKLLQGLKNMGLDPRVVTSIDLGLIMEAAPSEDELAELLVKGPQGGMDDRKTAAMKEMSESTINLRQGELSYTRETERTGKALRTTVALLLALAIIIAGDITFKLYKTSQDIASVEASIVRAYSDVFPEEKLTGVQGLSYKMQSHISALRKKEEAFSGADPLEFLMELGGIKVPEVTFDDITLEAGHVSLTGSAPSLSAVENQKSRLESFLAEVNITGTEQSGEDRIIFSMTAKRQGQ